MSSPDLVLRVGPVAGFLPKPTFLSSRTPSTIYPKKKGPSLTSLNYYKSPSAAFFPGGKNLDHIPKEFRQDNLKDGLMDNYKNTPEYLYGLPASQLDIFLSENNPFRRLSENVSEESISSSASYMKHGGMLSLFPMENRPSIYSSSATMSSSRKRRNAPPDLPSILLDARICYLGLPIYDAVAELIVAELFYLDKKSNTRPIYMYINSHGSQDEQKQLVGAETDAFAIADAMERCKAPIYTINCGVAYGQAAMLLSLGNKGKRLTLRNASARLYLPRAEKSNGTSTDLWIRGKELDVYAEYYVEILEKSTGKPKEEIREDIKDGKFLVAEKAIEYGIVDKIVDKLDAFDFRRNVGKRRAKRPKTGDTTRKEGAASGMRTREGAAAPVRP